MRTTMKCRNTLATITFKIQILFFLGGCTTVIKIPDFPLSYSGRSTIDKLIEAVAQNDAETVRKILKDKSFTGKSLIFYGDPGLRYMAQDRAYGLMDLAVIGSSREFSQQALSGVCRVEVVNALLDAQLPPRSVDFENA